MVILGALSLTYPFRIFSTFLSCTTHSGSFLLFNFGEEIKFMLNLAIAAISGCIQCVYNLSSFHVCISL